MSSLDVKLTYPNRKVWLLFWSLFLWSCFFPGGWLDDDVPALRVPSGLWSEPQCTNCWHCLHFERSFRSFSWAGVIRGLFRPLGLNDSELDPSVRLVPLFLSWGLWRFLSHWRRTLATELHWMFFMYSSLSMLFNASTSCDVAAKRIDTRCASSTQEFFKNINAVNDSCRLINFPF